MDSLVAGVADGGGDELSDEELEEPAPESELETVVFFGVERESVR